MSMEQFIRAIAGSFVLISLALGHYVTPWAYLFTAFVGANLLQSAFTQWCLMEVILERAGVAERAGSWGPAAGPEKGEGAFGRL